MTRCACACMFASMLMLTLHSMAGLGCTSEQHEGRDVEEAQSAGSDTTPEIAHMDLAPETSDVTPNLDCPYTISHVDQMDYPGLGFHVSLVLNGSRELRVLVTACDSPVPDVYVEFREISDDRGICALKASSAYTGKDGIAVVQVGSPQALQGGECKFSACLGQECVDFNVRVNCKCVEPLVVVFGNYSGAKPMVNSGMVYLYRKEAGLNRPVCADLPPDEWALVPTETKGPIFNLEPAEFPTLPDLDVGKSPVQDYTVRCIASQASGPPVAYGCVDDVRVELGARTAVECPLADIDAD